MNKNRPVVVHGTGEAARLAAARFRRAGVSIRAFADPVRRGEFLGRPVVSPEEAAAMGVPVFVASIFEGEIRPIYERAGVEVLPRYFLRQRFGPNDLPGEGDLARLRAVLSDEASHRVLDRLLELRRRPAGLVVNDILSGPQYFEAGLYRPRADEVFVDGGAFVGETYRAFVAASGGRYARYIAYEPSEQSRAALSAAVAGDARAEVRPYALGRAHARAGFVEAGPRSRLREEGDAIEIVALDEEGIVPTFVKLDIEGAEADAIEGMARTLRAHRPAVAVCAYHRPEDLWVLPLRLSALLPGHRIVLRHHRPHDDTETVAYALP